MSAENYRTDHSKQTEVKSNVSNPIDDGTQGCDAKTINIAAFVDALFTGVPPGYIEVRIIEDKKQGAVVDRRWYGTRGNALDDLPRLLRLAAERDAAVFFGVLPRVAMGRGTANDTLPSVVVWTDLDFKDYEGGEAEARRRLTEFPIPPSIIVRSAHGLHVYWLLREPADPTELAALSKRLAGVLGGDHAFDAARLLRLPGSYNRKDPTNPILVEIEVLEADRAYNASEITDALDLVESQDPDLGTTPPGEDEPHVDRELPLSVRSLILKNKRIGRFFNGEGKPELGENGKPLDRSSSGYDFSLVVALAKAGVRDESDLVSALWHRPDGAAQAKGLEYIRRTVRSALEIVVNTEEESAALAVDFEVQSVRIFDSNPARYEFTIQGVVMTVTSPELRSPRQFAIKFMDAIHRVPQVPSKSEEWAAVVNRWLQGAETVELPPEASYEPALREAIERAISEMVVGDAVEDLDHGKAVLLSDSQRAFKVSAVLRRLRDDYPDVETGEVAAMLKRMGFSSHSTTVAGCPARVWRSDKPTADTRAEQA